MQRNCFMTLIQAFYYHDFTLVFYFEKNHCTGLSQDRMFLFLSALKGKLSVFIFTHEKQALHV